jgi:glycosyltransferase involved in cell wall biosynthesis
MSRVSVIVPAFNAGPYVTDAVTSALAQTHRPHEVIVVDDGSTDDTRERLRAFDGQVQVLTQANRGAAAARNRGVAAARGEWIAFLDADDLWLPTKLDRQLAAVGACAISHTASWRFGPTLGGDVAVTWPPSWAAGAVLDRLVLGNFITTSSVIVRRDAVLAVGGFDEQLRRVHDWHLWLRLCRHHVLGYVREPLVRRRIHRASASFDARRTLPAHLHVLDSVFAATGCAQHLRRLRRRARAHACAASGDKAAQAGDRWFALYCHGLGALHDPLRWAPWRSLARIGLSYARGARRPIG